MKNSSLVLNLWLQGFLIIIRDTYLFRKYVLYLEIPMLYWLNNSYWICLEREEWKRK